MDEKNIFQLLQAKFLANHHNYVKNILMSPYAHRTCARDFFTSLSVESEISERREIEGKEYEVRFDEHK